MLDLDDPRTQWSLYLLNALRAKEVFRRDVDYVIQDGTVVIVDAGTGRAVPERRWTAGLHQAVEAKEGLSIRGDGGVLASISYQVLGSIGWLCREGNGGDGLGA